MCERWAARPRWCNFTVRSHIPTHPCHSDAWLIGIPHGMAPAGWDFSDPAYVDAAKHLATLRAEGLLGEVAACNFDVQHLRPVVDGLPAGTHCPRLAQRHASPSRPTPGLSPQAEACSCPQMARVNKSRLAWVSATETSPRSGGRPGAIIEAPAPRSGFFLNCRRGVGKLRGLV